MRADHDVDRAVGDALLDRGELRVVGTTTATCLPFMAATKAARSATSVLPKPTSPQISRSIGRPEASSLTVVSIAAC
jgi:hypothetical protein